MSLEGSDRVTVTVSVSSSLTDAELLLKLTDGTSLSKMVAVAWDEAIVAFVGLERLSRKDSFSSFVVSSRMGTVTVWLVSSGSKVSVPDVAV